MPSGSVLSQVAFARLRLCVWVIGFEGCVAAQITFSPLRIWRPIQALCLIGRSHQGLVFIVIELVFVLAVLLVIVLW